MVLGACAAQSVLQLEDTQVQCAPSYLHGCHPGENRRVEKGNGVPLAWGFERGAQHPLRLLSITSAPWGVRLCLVGSASAEVPNSDCSGRLRIGVLDFHPILRSLSS